MKITFISQASVLFETEDAIIWTDPWLFGTAFNDSWRLFPEPQFDEDWYGKITHLWISHEHPDHFHIPTLKSLPSEFKNRVTLLFQDNNSDKMPNAFQRLGFQNIQLLKNRKITQIAPKTKIHNYQVGQMDSSLAVISGGKTVLNLNDCEINSRDARICKKDLGTIDIVLNQFSMAGYNGYYDYDQHLPKTAQHILDTMVENHRDLGASITIPIASYVYFCQEDNKFMNDYANTPADIHEKFVAANLDCRFLGINEVMDTNNIKAHDKEASFQRMREVYANKNLITDELKSESLESVQQAFEERHEQLKKFYPKYFMKKLGPMTVRIPDLGKTIKLSLSDGKFQEVQTNNFDIQINSQPLYFAFKFTWGLQTLGVSARFLIKRNMEVWKWYRIITSLNNAEIYLKPKYFFRAANIAYFMSRIGQLPNQLRYQLSRMK